MQIMDIGVDLGSRVSKNYEGPFAYKCDLK